MLGYIRKVTKIDQLCHQQSSSSRNGSGQQQQRQRQQQQQQQKQQSSSMIMMTVINDSNRLLVPVDTIDTDVNRTNSDSNSATNMMMNNNNGDDDGDDEKLSADDQKSTSTKTVFHTPKRKSLFKRRHNLLPISSTINSGSSSSSNNRTRLSFNSNNNNSDHNIMEKSINNPTLINNDSQTYCSNISINHRHHHHHHHDQTHTIHSHNNNIKICPTIASALWRPLWPPGWHPRSNNTSSSSSASATTTTSNTKVPTSLSTTSDGGGGVSTLSSSSSLTRRSANNNNNNGDDIDNESNKIEDWLDEHPDFVNSYVIRKVSRSIIDKWLVTHSASTMGTLFPNNQNNTSSLAATSLAASSSTSPAAAGAVAAAPDSGANTPVRKISAHEFEASGGGYLRPMVSTTCDGMLTFLSLQDNMGRENSITASDSSDLFHASGSFGNRPRPRPRASIISLRSREQLESNSTDECELIFELVKDICNDLDVKSLCHKILKNVSILTQADRCSLFLVRGEKDEIENRYLVSQLFDVCGQSTIEQVSKNEEIIIPWGTGIVGHVAETGEAANIPDCYQDSRFTDTIDQKTGYKTCNMLCNPIFDIDGEVMGVAQVINKKDSKCFDKNDENVFVKYLQFCGIGLRNAQVYERSQLENKRNQVLLDLARMVFEKQSNIENIIYRILIHILSLLQCERCQIMLLECDDNDDDENDDFILAMNSNSTKISHDDSPTSKHLHLNAQQTASNYSSDRSPLSDCPSSNGSSCLESNYELQVNQVTMATRSFYRVFDLQAKDLEQIDFEKNQKTPFEGRFPINIGITGYVATTGETLNIADAYNDCRFDPIVDDQDDDNYGDNNNVDDGNRFRHKSILCMPIRNATRKIIGVAQLVNKLNGRPFNKNDENLFEAFAIFSGMGIENTHKFEKAVKSMAKQKVTLELLSYHALASEHEASKFARMLIPSTSSLSLSSLRFDDFSLNEDQMIKACIRMFIDLDLIERFHIDYKVLCKWILSVRKNYRPVLYHNWRHAFNVAQMMFAIFVNSDMCFVLGELETMALIVACLCHDLDHRGTNNSFQIKTGSPLAQLYSTSTLEHHHFDQSLMILNSQGNQIWSNLSPQEYRRVVYVLEEAILATDLAVYFRKRDKFFQLVEQMKTTGQRDWSDENNRSLLRSMLMTCCDIAAITKPWQTQKVVAELVASEFYQQGDIEKEQLNIEPIDMMNREKKDELPKMQMSFIDTICLPVYQAFAKLGPSPMKILLNGVTDNREAWHLLSSQPYQLNIRQTNSTSSTTTTTITTTDTTINQTKTITVPPSPPSPTIETPSSTFIDDEPNV
nr:dual 3',5'-cyclic-AMP and -GMP phosphodiesterase 11-like [Dermatophagoides farinae]